MKIAVCFSSQLRTGTLAYKNIKNYLGEMYDSCTFFAHIWNINTRKLYTRLGKVVLPDRLEVSNDEINFWKKLYPVQSLQIENYDNVKTEHDKNELWFDPIYYSWYKSLELMEQYTIKNKVKFDLVVKLRPDIIFEPSRKFSKEILFNYLNNNQDTFFVETLGNKWETDIWMNDVYWVSKPSIMKIAKNFYIEQCNNRLSNNHDFTFLKYLRKNKIQLGSMGTNDYGCHKLECIQYDTIEEYQKCFDCERYYFQPVEHNPNLISLPGEQ